MAKNDDRFQQALQGIHVPVLTLDNKWHRLFNQADATPEIKKLEEELNTLVKHQGKLNTESKDLKRIKNDLMREIVEQMDDADKQAVRKAEENKRLINEINEKLEDYQDQLLELPRQIDEVNVKLMLATMEICYDVLLRNTDEIDEIGAWIRDMRIELKKNVIKKQEMEIKNVEMYSYMHDIFGPQVIELFDIKYDVESKKQEILDKQRAAREKKQLEQAMKEQAQKQKAEADKES